MRMGPRSISLSYDALHCRESEKIQGREIVDSLNDWVDIDCQFQNIQIRMEMKERSIGEEGSHDQQVSDQ